MKAIAAASSSPRVVSAGLERALAPDVARGVMLLLIALSHAPAFVSDSSAGPANAAAVFVRSLVAENQARWMFIVLFGYALGQLVVRAAARGQDWPSLQRSLHRRAWVLLAIGLLHTALLVPVDIIAMYGGALLVVRRLLRAGARTLLQVAGLSLPLAIALITLQTHRALFAQVGGQPETMVPYMAASYPTHVVSRLGLWAPNTLAGVIIVLPGMLAGIWAARRQFLDRPERHVRQLVGLSAALLALALLCRLPSAILAAGWARADSSTLLWVASLAHTIGGQAGGLGLAAAVATLVVRARREGRAVQALAALGQRSLTCYLSQSLAWLLLFYPFTLGLAERVSVAGSLLIAAAVWLATLGLAEAMRLAGTAGPLERLVRRLTR